MTSWRDVNFSCFQLDSAQDTPQLFHILTSLLLRLTPNSSYHPQIFFTSNHQPTDQQAAVPIMSGPGAHAGNSASDAIRKGVGLVHVRMPPFFLNTHADAISGRR